MRWVLIIAIVFLLTACTAGEGKGMYGALAKSQRENAGAITGQVIGDIYTTRPCIDETDCGPSQACVNATCVVAP